MATTQRPSNLLGASDKVIQFPHTFFFFVLKVFLVCLNIQDLNFFLREFGWGSMHHRSRICFSPMIAFFSPKLVTKVGKD
jgi:hypothetical protein